MTEEREQSWTRIAFSGDFPTYIRCLAFSIEVKTSASGYKYMIFYIKYKAVFIYWTTTEPKLNPNLSGKHYKYKDYNEPMRRHKESSRDQHKARENACDQISFTFAFVLE